MHREFKNPWQLKAAAILLCAFLSPSRAAAQDDKLSEEHVEQQDHPQHSGGDPTGMYGSYPMNRDSGGTSWQPDSSPMEGIPFGGRGWSGMVHGFFNVVYNEDPAPRGTGETFSTNMFMLSTRHGLAKGKFGFRFMATGEPTMGSLGYPVLLQTGETFDGRNPLIDRQHPHDLVMELAVTYTHPLSEDDSIFVYFAPVGSPAIGPTPFMHRGSGDDNPIAPITHHWLDSTHITYGVLTLGLVANNKVKFEGSIFNGREPDEERWKIESPTFDSYAGRVSVNPSKNWSLQGSFASLKEPEQLHQGLDILRLTASVTYNKRLFEGNWQTTAAWGRNKRESRVANLQAASANAAGVQSHVHFRVAITPILIQQAFLVESSWNLKNRHTIFGRFEWVDKDELFPPIDRRHSEVYGVSKLTAGYIFDFLSTRHFAAGGGLSGSIHYLPADLDFVYGMKPKSFNVFVRFKVK